MAEAQERIRAFLAIEPDDAARAAVGRLIRRLRNLPGRISWVRPENVHLTLRFLGGVDPALLDAYVQRLEPDVARLAPFAARIRGLGVFPNPRRPSVIWTGLETEGETLLQVQQLAEKAARDLGLKPERRRFVPHITLGRVRRSDAKLDLRAVIHDERDFDGGAFDVRAVSLFSSELTPQGARHTQLRELTFNGTPPSHSA